MQQGHLNSSWSINYSARNTFLRIPVLVFLNTVPEVRAIRAGNWQSLLI